MSDDYQVGYGKPPDQTRFRKGASGNPRTAQGSEESKDRPDGGNEREGRDPGR